MLRALRVLTLEAFRLLTRDKIFLPAVIVCIAVSVLANLASDWAIEDFSKILFDVGYFGFHVGGSLVAIFWGAKAVTDSRQEGALEVQLAAPVSRTTWLVGKFMGMVLALLALAVIMLAVWQALMLLNAFGWMTPRALVIFAFMIGSWIVSAAVATLFASFCRQPVAVFAALSLWLSGLASALVERSLSPSTPALTRKTVETIARVWDFQQFNLLPFAAQTGFLPPGEIGWRAAYCGLLIIFLISLACMIFSRRDAIS